MENDKTFCFRSTQEADTNIRMDYTLTFDDLLALDERDGTDICESNQVVTTAQPQKASNCTELQQEKQDNDSGKKVLEFDSEEFLQTPTKIFASSRTSTSPRVLVDRNLGVQRPQTTEDGNCTLLFGTENCQVNRENNPYELPKEKQENDSRQRKSDLDPEASIRTPTKIFNNSRISTSSHVLVANDHRVQKSQNAEYGNFISPSDTENRQSNLMESSGQPQQMNNCDELRQNMYSEKRKPGPDPEASIQIPEKIFKRNSTSNRILIDNNPEVQTPQRTEYGNCISQFGTEICQQNQVKSEVESQKETNPSELQNGNQDNDSGKKKPDFNPEASIQTPTKILASKRKSTSPRILGAYSPGNQRPQNMEYANSTSQPKDTYGLHYDSSETSSTETFPRKNLQTYPAFHDPSYNIQKAGLKTSGNATQLKFQFENVNPLSQENVIPYQGNHQLIHGQILQPGNILNLQNPFPNPFLQNRMNPLGNMVNDPYINYPMLQNIIVANPLSQENDKLYQENPQLIQGQTLQLGNILNLQNPFPNPFLQNGMNALGNMVNDPQINYPMMQNTYVLYEQQPNVLNLHSNTSVTNYPETPQILPSSSEHTVDLSCATIDKMTVTKEIDLLRQNKHPLKDLVSKTEKQNPSRSNFRTPPHVHFLTNHIQSIEKKSSEKITLQSSMYQKNEARNTDKSFQQKQAEKSSQQKIIENTQQNNLKNSLHQKNLEESEQKTLDQGAQKTTDRSIQQKKLDQIAQKRTLDQIIQKRTLDQIAQKKELDQIVKKKELDQIVKKKELDQIVQKKTLDQIVQKKTSDQIVQKKTSDQIVQKKTLDQIVQNLGECVQQKNMEHENVTMNIQQENVTMNTQQENVTMNTQQENVTMNTQQENVTMNTQQENVTMNTQEENVESVTQQENSSVFTGKGYDSIEDFITALKNGTLYKIH